MSIAIGPTRPSAQRCPNILGTTTCSPNALQATLVTHAFQSHAGLAHAPCRGLVGKLELGGGLEVGKLGLGRRHCLSAAKPKNQMKSVMLANAIVLQCLGWVELFSHSDQSLGVDGNIFLVPNHPLDSFDRVLVAHVQGGCATSERLDKNGELT
jgi:hypothetical protein